MPAQRRSARVHVAAGVALSGLLIIVIGSFLPWIKSGAVQRDSFEIVGVIDRLGPQDNAILAFALSGWIAVPPACVLAIGLYVLGLARTAAACAITVSVVAGTVGLAIYVVGGDGFGLVTSVPAGPLTTCLGGMIALSGSLGILLRLRTRSGVRQDTKARGDRPRAQT